VTRPVETRRTAARWHESLSTVGVGNKIIQGWHIGQKEAGGGKQPLIMSAKGCVSVGPCEPRLKGALLKHKNKTENKALLHMDCNFLCPCEDVSRAPNTARNGRIDPAPCGNRQVRGRVEGGGGGLGFRHQTSRLRWRVEGGGGGSCFRHQTSLTHRPQTF
jgi:hypothetical protein